MLFSSLIFLYAFLPIVLIANFLIKNEYRNRLLLISSLIFFAWGGVSYTILLIGSLVLNYLTGLLIEKYRGTKNCKITLAIGIIINLLFLTVFKYADFVIENINFLGAWLNWKLVDKPGIVLPLGISFYTFQAMSYIIDVYRQEAKVQKNFFKLALYISFFPQLIAGPIVRYNLIEKQLTNRKNHLANLSKGIEIFVLGLFKKVLFANQFGMIADVVFNTPINEISTFSSWIGIIAYSLQIYYDFSGYSDMAIGLGRMFGFRFPENFNFPYISRSIREFWTRWHMTLGGWFRNYLYIPLGGNKKGNSRTIANLLIVFFATAIWHGASWNFVIWGMLHGFFMMLERLGLEKLLKVAGRPVQTIYMLLIVVVTWVFFRAENASQALEYCQKMFAFNSFELHSDLIPLVNNRFFILVAFFGVLSATQVWLHIHKIAQSTYGRIKSNYIAKTTRYTQQLLLSFGIVVALLLCTMLLVGNTYNPFIYFRF